MEAQVSSLLDDNKILVEESATLYEQLANFDYNNTVIKIVDKHGLLNEDLLLGPAYVVLEDELFSKNGVARRVSTLLEASSRNTLWLFDNTTGQRTYLKVEAGETIIFMASQANTAGEIFLQYEVCYTNNNFSCTSDLVQTDIKIK